MGLLFGSPNPKYNWKQLYRQEYENYKNRGCFTLKLNKDGMRIIGSSTQIDFLGMTVNVGLKSGKWVYELEMVKSCLTQNGFICTKFETGSGASGVGDDRYSWSYDPRRKRTFCEQGEATLGKERWKEGDISAYAIDLEEKKDGMFH